VLDADHTAALPTMSEAELRAVGERLTAIEQRISDQRRALHERIDKLQAEIVSRYKTGEASVDGLLT
jgi:chaperonin cofactor prefoldin